MVDYLDYNGEKIPIRISLMVWKNAEIEWLQNHNDSIISAFNSADDKNNIKSLIFLEALVVLLKHAIEMGCKLTNTEIKAEWMDAEMLLDDEKIFFDFFNILQSSIKTNNTGISNNNNEQKKMKSKM